MQVHAYPYDATGSTFIVEMHDAVWRRAGFSAGSFAPGRGAMTAAIAVIGDLFADLLDGATAAGQQLPLDQLRHGALRVLAGRQRRAARRRRAHRALLHRLRHEAGDGGRAGAGRLAARAVHSGPGVGGVRRRAAAGGGVHPAGGAGEPGVVREPRPVRAPGAGAVRVQPAHPQPPGDAGQPAAARPGVRVHRGGRVQRRDRDGRGYAADVPPATGCAGSSCATGWSSRRWTCTRRSTGCRPTSTSCTSAARRSAVPGW